MADTLEQITSRISALRAELADLEIAERVIHSFSNGSKAVGVQRRRSVPREGDAQAVAHPKKKGADLAGTSLVEAAEAILKESTSPLHYKIIAERAGERGYKSPRGEVRVGSFWAILNRNKDKFSGQGDGTFALVTAASKEGE